MKPEIMKEAYSQFRKEILGLFARVHELGVETGRPDLKDYAATLLASVNQPFLFVVVGEVKSGKSSFINALLGQAICKVAPDPCTDAIHKIVYAETAYERAYGPHLKELGLPIDILRDVAIVDTPGTNSIIDRHQEITERFIPESDLAIFVFPALNPYARTSWDLFDLVYKEWHKKIIFLLQQADRASDEELSTNLARVHELAAARGVEKPAVFVVSAKRAMAGLEDNGVDDVWAFIRSTVTGGMHYRYKMESLLTTALALLDKINEEISLQTKTLKTDQTERGRIEKFLGRAKTNTARGVEMLQNSLIEAYNKHTRSAIETFEDGLALPRLFVSSFRGAFKKQNAFSAWVEDLHKIFTEQFNREAELLGREGAAHLSDNIAHFMSVLLDDLKDSRSAVSMDARRSFDSRNAQRVEAIDEAIANLFGLLGETTLREKIRPEGLRKIGDQAVISMFITTVGGILAASTHLVIFDITGGVFATIGALLAVHTLVFKRRTIIKRFREGFEQGRVALETQLRERLAAQVESLFVELYNAFSPFFDNIAERETNLRDLEQRSTELVQTLELERERVGKLE